MVQICVVLFVIFPFVIMFPMCLCYLILWCLLQLLPLLPVLFTGTFKSFKFVCAYIYSVVSLCSYISSALCRLLTFISLFLPVSAGCVKSSPLERKLKIQLNYKSKTVKLLFSFCNLKNILSTRQRQIIYAAKPNRVNDDVY